MTVERIIMFTFAGREANMSLQMPFVRKMLQEHPRLEVHIWNLAQNGSDNRYVRGLEGGRIRVINDMYRQGSCWERFNDIYRIYADPKFQNCIFIKYDDDVVFMESNRLRTFVQTVDDHRDHVISAQVINNGACTRMEPGLWGMYQSLDIDLLDVHLSAEYARRSHAFMIDNWSRLVRQKTNRYFAHDWLSINFIGYDWEMGRRIANLIGSRDRDWVAGRDHREVALGDEGAVNCLPRLILRGFLAGHLYFGPQNKLLSPVELDAIREQYAIVGQKYLDSGEYE